MNLKDYFPYLKHNDGEIYLDNAATSLKLQSVIDAEAEYLEKISANPHTTVFSNGYKSTQIIDECRKKIAQFIGAKNFNEVIFTSGTTHSLNQIAFGLKNKLDSSSNVVLTHVEHSSNLLPWIKVCEETKAKIKYCHMLANGSIDIDKLLEIIDKNTKVFSFAAISNTIGQINDIKAIVKAVRKINEDILIVIDAAQSIAHEITNVLDWDIDFLSFSAHKFYGPFGLGILWGKFEKLDLLEPLMYGGGNNIDIKNDQYIMSELPSKLEAGTPNISAIYGFIKVFEFLEKQDFLKLIKHEKMLKEYFIKLVHNNPISHIDFYNLHNSEPIIIFNVKNADSQDIGTFLSKRYNISVRTGSHCARQTNNILGTNRMVRASFSIYNTFEEMKKLYEALVDSKTELKKFCKK